MSNKLGVFLLGVLLGALGGAVLMRRRMDDEDDEEYAELEDELASATEEPPPLVHSVIDPRLDQRLPTMAKPPEQPPPTEEDL